jgi:KaiC/GvpD/RAD55 family RecA-like ATPase
MLNGINRYFEYCETTDDMPSIKGMMIHMKMYRDDFYRYAKDGRYAEMLEQARLIIDHWAERAVWESKGMAAGKIAYMKNVHSWAEKIDTNNVTEIRKVSVEEATSRIKMLAPLLLDVLKSQNTVNQIARPDGDGVVVEDAEIIEAG